MSEPHVLLCGPAIDAAESAAHLEMLRGISLPNATKFVITTGKFDCEKAAFGFNIEANYPAEVAELQTLARAAEAAGQSEQCFRDGYDLYCLRRLVEEKTGFEFAVLLRNAAGFDDLWPGLQSRIKEKLFLSFASQPFEEAGAVATNLAINLTDNRALAFLERLGEIYASGIPYALAAYSLDAGLRLAFDSLGLEQSIAQSLEGRGQPVLPMHRSALGRPISSRSAAEPALSGR